MGAYVISVLKVRDQVSFETYRDCAARSIAAYGGQYVVRGGDVEVLEGAECPSGIVVVKFEDVAAAKRWYRSDEYSKALDVRDAALDRVLFLADGVD